MGVGKALTHLHGRLVMVLIRASAGMDSLEMSARLTGAPGCCMLLYLVSLRIEGYIVRLIQDAGDEGLRNGTVA